MSNYYGYREVKVMIAHKLMTMDGWKIYGYHPDESDFMTDYYSPVHWDGVAEKNGYVLCVNIYGEAKPQEVRSYSNKSATGNKDIMEKIAKLEAMTVERGASEAEAASAKASIEKLQKKMSESKEEYVVVDTVPGHMAHPSKMNWHLEKDGVIVLKGNRILKYSSVYNYYNYERDLKDL